VSAELSYYGCDSPMHCPAAARARIVGGNVYRVFKPATEFVAAAALLVLFLPVIAAAWLLVRLTSAGPGFYKQERVGLRGRTFWIYKIRSMYRDCERVSGAVWSNGDDPRVTPVGRVLRATHIDELPQLFNVLMGQMSLVGPRPERPVFTQSLELALPDYDDRHLVRPGITGLAQVQLPPDSDLEGVRRKLLCDLYYVQHFDPSLDLRLVACTGLAALGVPFSLLAKVLRIPCLREMECVCGGLPAEDVGLSGVHVQPA
jgi:lipopolysaccharide/colanic/teichoic acid biosynthesis glycosyltransferase